MIITVFGASGQVGKRIVRIALGKGYEVRAFGRNINHLIDEEAGNKNLHAIRGFVFDEKDVFEAVKGADAVISALGGSFDGTDRSRSLGMKNIVAQMQKAGVKRIVALGGMGILNADEQTLLIDTEHYPEIYLPVGREHQHAYEALQQSKLDWTFVCAPDIKDAEITGAFHTSANYPPQPNNFHINAGDLALFMVNEIGDSRFIQSRVGISN